jgi:hypothetical protein
MVYVCVCVCVGGGGGIVAATADARACVRRMTMFLKAHHHHSPPPLTSTRHHHSPLTTAHHHHSQSHLPTAHHHSPSHHHTSHRSPPPTTSTVTHYHHHHHHHHPPPQPLTHITPTNVTFAPTRYPCVSEPTHVFTTDATDPANPGGVFVGVESKNVCKTAVTRMYKLPDGSIPPICQQPDRLPICYP